MQSRGHQASWVGAFYCQCPKIGGVFSDGNVHLFIGYPVNGDWVMSLLQQEKIEFDDAKELIIKSGRGLARRLQDLSLWRSARADLAAQAYVDEAAVVHAQTNKPWKRIPLIDEWKAQNTQQFMRRKKFLVLVGPTGVGKTEFVKAMFGPKHTLELNAAGMQHPCLRDFNPELHRCILWDEGEASLVASNRKLFQCPACFVDLGFSPTASMTYKVMVNKCVMVINSNRWYEQLQKLNPGDREWIEGNQVAVHVTSPLWDESSD